MDKLFIRIFKLLDKFFNKMLELFGALFKDLIRGILWGTLSTILQVLVLFGTAFIISKTELESVWLNSGYQDAIRIIASVSISVIISILIYIKARKVFMPLVFLIFSAYIWPMCLIIILKNDR